MVHINKPIYMSHIHFYIINTGPGILIILLITCLQYAQNQLVQFFFMPVR